MAKSRGVVANVREVKGAIAFLKYLHGDWHNNYLILAVVAWLHAESGGLSNVIGNNPFNLRPGSDDAKFRAGIRRSKKGNGYFSVYKSLDAGFQATANRLLSAGHDWRHYDLIVGAAKAQRGNSAEAQQSVARDFLMAVAMSAWDAGRYGLKDNDPATNNLLRIWATFTGLTLPPPPKSKPKPPKPFPKLPTVIQPPIKHHFPDPHEAAQFYHARRPVAPEGTTGL